MFELNVIIPLGICVSYIVLLFIKCGNSCIFYTINGYKMPEVYVTERHTVEHFDDDCEFLCYQNPDKCVAGNVVRQSNGTFQCQFVSVSIQTQYIGMLDQITTGKYFSRSSTEALPAEIGVSNGASCTASSIYNSNYRCTKALYDNISEWATHTEGAGAWIMIQLSQTYYLTRVELQGRCASLSNRAKETQFIFDDASIQKYLSPPCTFDNCPSSATSVSLSPHVRSSSLNVTVKETCDSSTIIDVGYRFIKIWAWQL